MGYSVASGANFGSPAGECRSIGAPVGLDRIADVDDSRTFARRGELHDAPRQAIVRQHQVHKPLLRDFQASISECRARAEPKLAHVVQATLQQHQRAPGWSTRKTRGPSTGSVSTSSARRVTAVRNWRSVSGARTGLPSGCGMRTPATMRLARISSANDVNVVTYATGMPARSISLAIAAPQRVQVLQVAVRITPCTSAACSSWAISSPKRRALVYPTPNPPIAS